MPDFTKLTDKEEKELEQFENFRKKRLDFVLTKVSARSAVILSNVISSTLSADKREDLELLGSLSERKAKAYSKVAPCNGAISWATYKLLEAFSKLKL